MRHATYVGPLAHLQGKTALLLPSRGGPDYVAAQFDDRSLTRSGRPLDTVLRARLQFPTEHASAKPPSDALGFNWHRFRATDFKENPHA